jgi:hypothetical protein
MDTANILKAIIGADVPFFEKLPSKFPASENSGQRPVAVDCILSQVFSNQNINNV